MPGKLRKASARESVQDTLNNLIEQFSDVYCFYRELIQNSLDAGTNRVDVSLEFMPPEQKNADGVIIINIDDYGEGMNREIIDNQLTRLFSSSKENDLSKIGKFGIGFVSVFAIKPKAVNIDTSRDGEDWRILFDEDRKFKRIKRDYPVDGTKIQIFKPGIQKFFDTFLQKSKETVIFWCKHSEAEIYFQDELINQPFEVDSVCRIHETTDTAEIAAGYTSDEAPFFGYYNQGLTLMEGKKKFFHQVMFKVKSKYLEHTLTRDNIMEDENYYKAMQAVEELVNTKLPSKLFKMIEDELKKGNKETELYQQLLEFVEYYFMNPQVIPADCKKNYIARDIDENLISVNDLLSLKSQGVIFYDEGKNPVTEALTKQGKKIIKSAGNSKLQKLLRKLSGKFWNKNNVQKASTHYFILPITEKAYLTSVQEKLISKVNEINRRMNNKTGSCKFANFKYKDSCVSDRIYLMQEKPGELELLENGAKSGKTASSLFSLFSKSRTLILNQEHPYIKNILKLGETDPHMASYFLAKLLYMDDGVDTDTDTALSAICLEMQGVKA